jgi:hypothetical protein
VLWLLDLDSGKKVQCVDWLIAEIDVVEADCIKLCDQPKSWQGATTQIHFDLDDDEAFPSMATMKQMEQPATIPDSQSAAPAGWSKGGMSMIISEMQTMISAQSKMMEMFMQQQTEQMKWEQAVMTQQISHLISLVSQMIPTNNQYASTTPTNVLSGLRLSSQHQLHHFWIHSTHRITTIQTELIHTNHRVENFFNK